MLNVTNNSEIIWPELIHHKIDLMTGVSEIIRGLASMEMALWLLDTNDLKPEYKNEESLLIAFDCEVPT